jgi:predicted CoA-binding protein
MSGEACPLPTDSERNQQSIIANLLKARRIAIVGLSDDPGRPSYEIASYLILHGKEVVPVNPNHENVLGHKCYASLKEIPGAIDLVNVFRRSEFCADVVRDAIAIGAGGVWLQAGIISSEAARLAREAKMPFVQNRCIMVDHMHYAPTTGCS